MLWAWLEIKNKKDLKFFKNTINFLVLTDCIGEFIVLDTDLVEIDENVE